MKSRHDDVLFTLNQVNFFRFSLLILLLRFIPQASFSVFYKLTLLILAEVASSTNSQHNSAHSSKQHKSPEQSPRPRRDSDTMFDGTHLPALLYLLLVCKLPSSCSFFCGGR